MKKDISLLEESSLLEFSRKQQEVLHEILQETRRICGWFSHALSYFVLPVGDYAARKWLQQASTPYFAEIQEYAAQAGTAGVYAFNLSYEWGCTSAGFATQDGPEMLRILDWPFPALGYTVFVVRLPAQPGSYYAVTWPGLAGIFQGMAPGRFAAAINQAPGRIHGYGPVGDWLKNRQIVSREKALPPAHLLREVFEQATDYKEAKTRLAQTPVCMPVIYTLVGTCEEQACVIERVEEDFRIRELAALPCVCTANHFLSSVGQAEQPHTPKQKGWQARPVDSTGRLELISNQQYKGFSSEDFTWLSFPVINRFTRLALLANPHKGTLQLQGFEHGEPVTAVFRLSGCPQNSNLLRT